MQPMVVRTKDEARREFAKNLNEALTAQGAPPRARPNWLRSRLGNIVSRETCRKWLAGEDLPDQGNLSVLISIFGLNAQQLRTGEWEPPPGIKDEQLSFLMKSWPHLTEHGRELIMGILNWDPGVTAHRPGSRRRA